MSSLCLSAQKFIKRLFDVIVSSTMLVILLPLWIVIALLIELDSEGPVFFLQQRPGLNGRLFTVYKFRTMRPGSEKMVKGKEVTFDDERITRFGRFLRRYKIDELPQLINVLRGEMSLVGPRPERVDSLKDYTEETWKRLKMKPGLTGLAQVSGNIYIPLEDRYKLDVYYVEQFSILLDLRILLRTIDVVIRGEDRYVEKVLVAGETNWEGTESGE